MNTPKVAWGTLIAGAAVAAGVVLFAPTFTDQLPKLGTALLETVQQFGSWIAGLFTPGAEPMAEETKEVLKKVGGAVLIGGGATYLLSEKDNGPALPDVDSRGPSESFAAKEDMRKMQALMQIRMAAAGGMAPSGPMRA